MKRIAAFVLLAAASAVGQVQPPAAATNHSGASGLLYMTNPTNAVSISNAVRVASGLRIGMPAANVQKYMREHGMAKTNVSLLSLDRGRTSVWPYSLTGGASTLMLEMRSRRTGPGLFDRGDPTLTGAHIQSQGVNTLSISLTNGL